MKIILACLVVFVTILPVVSAESQGEFGILYGISHVIDGPQLISAPQTLYWMGFVNDQVGIGPEVEFMDSALGSGSLRAFGSRFTLFFNGHSRSTPYIFGQGQIGVSESRYGEDSGFGGGIGLGYQRRVGSDFIFRSEGRFRAIGDFSMISLTFGIGVKID